MGRRRIAPRRRGASDDEEYVLGEEDDGESCDESLVSDATEEEFEFGESSCGSEEEGKIVYDDDEEEEDGDPGEADGGKAAAVVAEEVKVEAAGLVLCDLRAKRSRVSVVREADEEKREKEEEEGVRSRRRKAVILYYAEEEEEEEDDERDEDFLPADGEDNDAQDEEISGDIKRGEKKRKPKAARRNTKKRLRRGRFSDDDEDFAVESEQSDSDFSYCDDDLTVKNTNAPFKRSNKIKNPERRRRLLVLPDSDCFLMEAEPRTMNNGATDPLQSRKTGRHQDQEKGKEKEGDDFGKQSCGICLSEEQKRTVQGKLDCCAHFFCFACIMEWSKVETRCPVCKRRFSTITKTSQLDAEFDTKKVVNVQIRDQVYQPSAAEVRQMLDPYGNVVCTECQQDVDDSLMLLCDICDSCAHTYCVGLGREVPEGNWYCHCCRSASTGPLLPLQNPDTLTDDSVAHGTEREDSAARIQANIYSQQSGSSPHLVALQRFDLNAPPVSDEICGARSPVIGAGAATLSGRRAIHQRIRILLSNSRPQRMLNQSNVLDEKVETMVQEVEQSGRSLFQQE